MTDVKLFNVEKEITWCPGCGDFIILKALKQAFSELGLTPTDTVVVSGIGQAAKTPHYINTNGFNGLHGRGLPAACGIHVANQDLNLFVVTGDGDAFSEGGNHFVHNIRRNLNLVHLVYDNQIYGLTKGQGSPTTAFAQKTTSQTKGVYLEALNPIALALSLNCGFVARGFAGDANQLVELIKEAYHYDGYAFIDILQPCVSFNKVNTYQWYKERVYKLDSNYDSSDKTLAFQTGQEWDSKIPTGIIYKENKTSYFKNLPHLSDDTVLIHQPWKVNNVQSLIDELK